MSSPANIFSFSRNQALESHPQLVSGSAEGLFLVLCDDQLQDASCIALQKTAERLGYGSEGITLARIGSSERKLNDQELFGLIEAIDPISVVIAGPNALRAFCSAYRIDHQNPSSFRCLCREVRALPNLDQMMESEDGKQQAWAALKTLPSLAS